MAGAIVFFARCPHISTVAHIVLAAALTSPPDAMFAP